MQLATGGPVAIGVIGFSGMALTPGIQQHIARPAVKTDTGRLRCRRVRLLMPPIFRMTRFSVSLANILMKRRHQRGAMAAGSHIATAEVGHHVDAGQLGQQRMVANLQGITGMRGMADGLAAADGAMAAAGRAP
jgi:hypothetical protein